MKLFWKNRTEEERNKIGESISKSLTKRIIKTEDASLCKCGCNKEVTWNFHNQRWNEYIWGHNATGQHFGKGMRINYPKNRKSRGPHSPETIDKLIKRAIARRDKTSFDSKERWKLPAYRAIYTSPEFGMKKREDMLRLWQNPVYKAKMLNKWKRTPNKLEKKMDAFLKTITNEFKFVGDGQVWIGGRCPDFININKEKKQLIEVFGSYWHEPDDEEFRKSHFKSCGFNTLVIWDKEFNDPQFLREKVIAFVS
jgi:very-short-patch-repair endonuclease